MAAVKAESETVGWVTSLSHGEAVQVVRIACVELNGFGGYIPTLVQAHLQAVGDVVSYKALAQFQQFGDAGQAEILHDVLYHGTVNMKAVVAARVASQIAGFLSTEQAGARNALGYAVQIIEEEAGRKIVRK